MDQRVIKACAVSNCDSQSSPFALENFYLPKRWFLSFLAIVLLFGFSPRAAMAAEVRPAANVEVGLPFASADFDGDHRPDFASVQRVTGSATSYWIQVRGSSSGWQLIRVFAPAGGLQIEARDVNGDHAVDLVLATAWFKDPVAIFLNDGHGRFSRAEANSFPQALNRSNGPQFSSSIQGVETPAASQRSSSSLTHEAGEFLESCPPKRWTATPNSKSFLNPFLVLRAGRAPPSEASQL